MKELVKVGISPGFRGFPRALTRVVEEGLDEDPLVLAHLPQLAHQLLQPLLLLDAQVAHAVRVPSKKRTGPQLLH